MQAGDLVRILRGDIHGAVGMVVITNVDLPQSGGRLGRRSRVHTVEMCGSNWRWRSGADGQSRIAFVEGDLEVISASR